MQQRLQAFFGASPHGMSIYSGFRSPEHQKRLWQNALKKYGSPNKARKWVAPPGRSNHNKGMAADLRYSSAEARKWAHQNAGKYGLHFRMGHEPWHIEPIPGWKGQLPQPQMATPLPVEQGVDLGKVLGNPLTKTIAQKRAKSQGMELDKTPEGRIKMRMSAPELGGLDKLAGVDLLRPQIGPDRAPARIGPPPKVPQPRPGIPELPTMLASTPGAGVQVNPSGPKAPGIGGLFEMLSSMGQQDAQQEAQAQQQAQMDAQKRMQWALNQGFGRGLL